MNFKQIHEQEAWDTSTEKGKQYKLDHNQKMLMNSLKQAPGFVQQFQRN